MKTSLQAIVTAVSIAAVASSVMMAQPPIAGPAANTSNAHGSAAGALVALGTRVVGWTHPERICRDCVLRIEP
jgi:hypothetical protein